MARSRRWMVLGVPVAAVMILATLMVGMGVPGAAAQEEAPHPAHIHTGTCDQLGDIAYPLTNITPIQGGEALGSAAAIPVEASETDVDVALGDLLTSDYAVNLHRSARQIQDYIACGNIGGRVVDNKLVIGLREVNKSGYSGVALLEEKDGKTHVTVYLVQAQAAGAGAATAAAPAAATKAPAAAKPTEAATAAPAEAATAAPTEAATAEAGTGAPAAAPEQVSIDIVDFAFQPATMEIPVGSTVAWTNKGSAPHTVTSDDGQFDSGILQPGDTFTATFTAPGAFAYHCNVHPSMTATITVTGGGGGQGTGGGQAAAPAAAGGEQVAVDIQNFSFNPDPVRVKVGDTVTWTNQDGVPHTVTGSEADVLQSGPIAPGKSFSHTFDKAGTFEYHCEFHANMVGSVVVE